MADVFFYELGIEDVLENGFNMLTATFKAALVLDNSNAISARETLHMVGSGGAGPGLTNELSPADRVTLTGVTLAAVGSSTRTLKWDSSLDVVFTAVPTNGSNNILGMVVMQDTGTNDTSALVCFLNGSIFPITTTGDNITVKFHSSGIGQMIMLTGT